MKAIGYCAMCVALAISLQGMACDTGSDGSGPIACGETMEPACVMEKAPKLDSRLISKAPTPRRTSGVQSRAAAGSSDGLSAKEWIAQRESGGDYNAVSPSGKYIGRYQLSKDKLNGDYSPENQEKVAESYVKSRYGSWENAKAHWEKYGWY